MSRLSRREWLSMAAGAVVSARLGWPPPAEGAELSLPSGASEESFDFETGGIDRWTVVAGQWVVEDMEGAPSGRKVLVQRATRNDFDVIVAPSGPYTAVDASMTFKPISGTEDASGGIVFRFAEDGTTSSARTPWKTISGCTSTTADDVRSRMPGSSPRLSAPGTASVWWP